MKTLDRSATLRELRDLVATYLEGSDDAPRAQELLDALDNKPAPAPSAQGSEMTVADWRNLARQSIEKSIETINDQEESDYYVALAGRCRLRAFALEQGCRLNSPGL